MADLEAVLADVSYLMAMEKSKSTPAARASKKIVLPDPSWVQIHHYHVRFWVLSVWLHILQHLVMKSLFQGLSCHAQIFRRQCTTRFRVYIRANYWWVLLNFERLNSLCIYIFWLVIIVGLTNVHNVLTAV